MVRKSVCEGLMRPIRKSRLEVDLRTFVGVSDGASYTGRHSFGIGILGSSMLRRELCMTDAGYAMLFSGEVYVINVLCVLRLEHLLCQFSEYVSRYATFIDPPHDTETLQVLNTYETIEYRRTNHISYFPIGCVHLIYYPY